MSQQKYLGERCGMHRVARWLHQVGIRLREHYNVEIVNRQCRMKIAPSNPLRWLDAGSFHADWSSRSAELLSIADMRIENSQYLSFTEYGCGPHSPFTQAVRLKSQRKVNRYDLRAWDNEVLACNLNDHRFPLKPADVGVLSGVLEYLDDIEGTLSYLSRFHRFALVSYAFRFNEPASPDYAAEIDRRLNKKGWINHLNQLEFTAACETLGSVLHTCVWNRHQVLVLLEFIRP